MSRIYHNPGCSTSRQVLAILRAAGEDPEVIDYLKTGWTGTLLQDLFAAAGISPAQALRRKESLVAELGLERPETGPDDILAAMIAHPRLVERPFVVTPKGTALCRPKEKVLALLARPLLTPVRAPDGKVIFDPSAAL